MRSGDDEIRGELPVARIRVKVVPSSSRNKICGWYGKQMKIKVQAPPEGGRANKAVLELIGETFGVKKSDVRLVSGTRSPEKVIEIRGLSEEALEGMNF